jgi:tripartite-type tricarboxylate transporter receptor subunit TctC
MTKVFRRRGLLAAAPLLMAPGLARAQGRPNVRIVVPYPPGGTVDATARFLSPRAAELLNQNWVIENRSGANGAIGADAVARAAPDGMTLLYSNEVLLMLKHVQRNMPLDPLTDLTPIVRTATVPQILVGSPRHIPHQDIRGLLEALRRNPTRYSFATPTLGSLGQLGAAALGQALGIEVLIVAYRGTGPAVQDVIAGNVSLLISPAGGVAPLIRDGQLRAFAVCSPQRIPGFPDLPTLSEIGFPDLVFESWTAMWGPRGLPAEIVNRVHATMNQVVGEPEMQRRIFDLGCTPIQEPLGRMAQQIAIEEERNPRLARLAKITPE